MSKFLQNNHCGVLLDFDGLLVDTESLHWKAYRMVCEEHGKGDPFVNEEDYLQAAHAKGGIVQRYEERWPEWIEQVGWSRIYDAKRRCYQMLIEHEAPRWMEGAEDFLSFLNTHRIPHGIVTNGRWDYLTPIRNQLPELQSVPFWITRDDVTIGKPDPEGYKKGVEKLGGRHLFTKIFGFEDALLGIEALVAAHVEPVLIAKENYPHAEKSLELGAQRFSSFHAYLAS